MKNFLSYLTALVAVCLAGAAAAQTYPSKAVRLIVPAAPGGSLDIVGRLLGQSLGQRLEHPVVVENRPGADTMIGTAAVAQAEPDGHTLLLNSSSPHVMQAYGVKLPFDSFKDLAPITSVASSMLVLIASKKLAVTTFQEMLSVGRNRELVYGHVGRSTPQFFGGQLSAQQAGLKFLFLTYRGSGPGATAVMSGDTDLFLVTPGPGAKLAETGRVVLLAVTGLSRDPILPNIPTIAESGIPGYSVGIPLLLFTTGGTPAGVMARLNKDLVAAMSGKAFADRMAVVGYSVSTSSSAEADAQVKTEYENYRSLIQARGLKLED